jgi:hypothetical protein
MRLVETLSQKTKGLGEEAMFLSYLDLPQWGLQRSSLCHDWRAHRPNRVRTRSRLSDFVMSPSFLAILDTMSLE